MKISWFVNCSHDGHASSRDVRQFVHWQSALEKSCLLCCALRWDGYFWLRSSGTLILSFDVYWKKFGSTPVRKVPPSQTRVSACPSLQIPTSLVSRKEWGTQTLAADASPLGQIKFVTELEFVPIDLRARWYRHENVKKKFLAVIVYLNSFIEQNLLFWECSSPPVVNRFIP